MNNTDSLACMKLYLNSPSGDLDPLCTEKMQTIMNHHENRVLDELSGKPTGRCVFDSLKNKTFFDDLVHKHVAQVSTDINEEEQQEKFDSLSNKMKATYEQVASECDHNPNYDGVFGHLLHVHGDSLESLTERYCTFSYVNNTGLINLHGVNSNPKEIDTSDIDCDGVIQRIRTQREGDLKEEMVKNNVTQEVSDCVIREDKAGNMFDVALGMIVNSRALLCVVHKNSNIQALTDKLNTFVVASTDCF
jgi:hypothetical protein